MLVAPPAWRPSDTFVVSASIVSWPAESGLRGFPPEKRQDDALVAAFVAAGVPRDHVVYLKDEQATAPAIRKAVKDVAARAGPKSTLVFSFQGHGMRTKRRTFLAAYDVRARSPESGLDVDELPALLKGFAGERLMLLGDFCHSGALATIAQRFEGTSVAAASFTSATASNRSTENWTFTEAVIDALQGRAAVDLDRDGAITFAEADRYVHDAMKTKEEQLTHAFRTSAFPAGLVLRKVAPGARKVGDVVESEWRPGQWYRAKIVRVEEDFFYFVHYEGEAGDDDEWVTARHLRDPGRAPAPIRTATPRRIVVGDAVCARWHDQWYRAELVAIVSGVLRVRYDDGEPGELGVADLLPLARKEELVPGARVLAGWRGQPRMYPGVIAAITDDGAIIRWDDGDAPSEVALRAIARIAD